ncbi:hypothetical protein GW17_00017140 [Ensete ventricosum]|nr:hypothetical protein GW17_00017140 [Ensete ventricosum]
MRLNCVKLFYAFLLCFHSERNKDRGSQPSIGAADHGQALCRGDRPWPGPLQERPATRRHLRAWHTPAREVPPECNGAYRRGNCPWAGWPPTTHSAAACVGAVAAAQ